MKIDKEQANIRIAKNIAALFNETNDITIINLGVGLPTTVSNYITNKKVFVQAENGMLGVGALATDEEAHPQLINAGRQAVKETPGCSFFDSATSFGMIRGGHINATVLGAFEVDEKGNVANWIIPNGKMFGVGGAMDLVVGAEKVIIAMMHTSKGKSKLLRKCTLPITGYGEVDILVTEMGMFFFENGIITLRKIAPDVNLEELRDVTEFEFLVADDLVDMID
ncbi:MAG TPA: succinyl-CoA--3-ketoacid-CoA transferase [Candidatus Avacidaminococcus intestinavium]|uniref:Succinyl-CoA--3-ketoacid-CoA transferase n=1 Tax=Candidatus Avacidaminococcus intestinavium TaxID=2840684 RepID=A0A9D1SLY1_9FIRM|nr:succinyl-CoA--3-ketoacid-CoA transferase [Candidatus Avacidaminococcus intestinavium]